MELVPWLSEFLSVVCAYAVPLALVGGAILIVGWIVYTSTTKPSLKESRVATRDYHRRYM